MRKRTIQKTMAMLTLSASMLVTSVPVSVMATEMPGEIVTEDTEQEVVLETETSGMSEESGIIDYEAPKIKSIELSATEVSAPGAIEVTAEATDDLSGVDYVYVQFGRLDEETGNLSYGAYSLSLYDYVQTYDEDLGEWVYEDATDGKLHGTITIDQNASKSTYMIYSISVQDNAGNSRYYSRENYKKDDPLEYKSYNFETGNYEVADTASDAINKLAFSVKNDVLTAKKATAKVASLILKADTVEAVGSVDVLGEFYVGKDAVGNPGSATVSFTKYEKKDDEVVSKTISVTLQDENKDGFCEGELEVDKYTEPGEYLFSGLSITSYTKENGKYKSQYSSMSVNRYGNISTSGISSYPDEILDMKLTVKNDGYEEKAPELKGLTVSGKELNVPGSLELVMDAPNTKSATVYINQKYTYSSYTSDYSYTSVYLNSEYTDANGKSKKYEDGKLHGTLTCNQYKGSADNLYIRKIELHPMKDNVSSSDYIYYSSDAENDNKNLGFWENYEYKQLPDDIMKISIVVKTDAYDSDLMTSTLSKTLVDDIKATKDDAVISVDITADGNIPAAVFEAIKGTKKTILFNSDGVQWVFKGENVTDPKAVDLSGMSWLGNYDEDSDIYSMLKKERVCTLGLNGEGSLPGKATVRFMFNSAMVRESGAEGLYIYAYDRVNGTLTLVKENASLTQESNLEFEISEISDFIVTKGAAPTTSVTPEGPTTWKEKQGTEGFITRLYNVTMGREADAAGLDYYVAQLQSGQTDAAAAAKEFFFSDEFMGKGYSDVQYIKTLYLTIFGRTAADEEVEYWLGFLENGATREYVFKGFAESAEFTALCNSYGVPRGDVALASYRDQNPDATAFVARLYTEILGRDFDPAGLEYWCEQYLTGQKTIEEIAAEQFTNSEEFVAQGLNNREYVTRMYKTFLGRTPDVDGLDYWAVMLQYGLKTRDDLLSEFTASAEFKGIKETYNLP